MSSCLHSDHYSFIPHTTIGLHYRPLLVCTASLGGALYPFRIRCPTLEQNKGYTRSLTSDVAFAMRERKGGLYTKGRVLFPSALEAEANGHAHIEDVRCLLDL